MTRSLKKTTKARVVLLGRSYVQDYSKRPKVQSHSGKCYVMRVGKNLKESSDVKNFNVICFVHLLRSNMQIFVRICLPVLLLQPEIAKRHLLLTLSQVPKWSRVRDSHDVNRIFFFRLIMLSSTTYICETFSLFFFGFWCLT